MSLPPSSERDPRTVCTCRKLQAGTSCDPTLMLVFVALVSQREALLSLALRLQQSSPQLSPLEALLSPPAADVDDALARVVLAYFAFYVVLSAQQGELYWERGLAAVSKPLLPSDSEIEPLAQLLWRRSARADDRKRWAAARVLLMRSVEGRSSSEETCVSGEIDCFLDDAVSTIQAQIDEAIA